MRIGNCLSRLNQLAWSVCLLVVLLAVGSGDARAASSESYEAYIWKDIPYYATPLPPGPAVQQAKAQPTALPVQPLGIVKQKPGAYPILDRQGEWLKLQIREGQEEKEGWVRIQQDALHIRTLPAKSGEDQTPLQVYKFLHHPVTVYKEADSRLGKLMEILPQRIQVLKQNNGWYQIRTDVGPGWLYGGPEYVTDKLGVHKIAVVKPATLYPYAATFWPSTGKVTEVPFETVAYASFGKWYLIDYKGVNQWLYAPNGEVTSVPAEFTNRKTEANGYVGNATFMTDPKTTRPADLLRRLTIEFEGKQQPFLETFIVRPAGQAERGFTFETYNAADPDGQAKLTAYASALFAPGDQMDQLEKAAMKARILLNDPDYKVNVIIGLPNPVGNGVDASARLRMVRVFEDTLLKQWNKANPQALRFVGFYWTHEMVADADRKLVQEVAASIHAKGYKFYWAPYYQAANAEQWKVLGFDFAWLQPNHYFASEKHPGEDLLGETYNLSRQTGAGTMLEWNWAFLSTPENVSSLNAYLDRGRLIGAHRTSLLLYDGEGAIDAFFSSYNKSLDGIRKKFFTYMLNPNAPY
ncbi:uncharacterized protein DUF4855 [Aneurinibacillus soli]|uniref:Uncharacterized protein n=1 Tax=Aneurinibacillus soli TaxID=1500254 RepID=A0A0U5B1T6_9BACL|nr:DUF4855 domain-containing protein [Aneurinibacillus soli]PYE64307.1 uncharacterized protein DUF4855 [Aneurinibacillus soli]BAU28256.1 hypothetical protein CB4_02430 [Aneurinibacillus soli]